MREQSGLSKNRDLTRELRHPAKKCSQERGNKKVFVNQVFRALE